MSINYTPLTIQSHFSLLESICRPEEIVSYAKENGYKSIGLTDTTNVSGAISLAKEAEEENIKTIIGTKLNINVNGTIKYLNLISKNLDGWKALVKIINKANRPGNIISSEPTIKLEDIDSLSDKNLICLVGGKNSVLDIYDNKSEQIKFLSLLKSCFGNIYLAASAIDGVETGIVRDLSKTTNIKVASAPNIKYCKKEDAADYRLLLAIESEMSIPKIQKLLTRGENFKHRIYFENDKYFIPSIKDLLDFGNLENEIECTQEIDSLCEKYSVGSSPKLPNFECPNNMSEADYLRQLCREGWGKKVKKDWDKNVYGDRVKYELSVFSEANLNGYFLIVQDYINWSKRNGALIGPGRGSVAGSLVAYLIGITNIDPIPNGLLFERFYNPGRNVKGKASYPDIDVDFPTSFREKVIDYIKNKYGKGRVCRISTYGRLQGRGAAKEVLRLNETCGFQEINEITERIPQEFQIVDQMEDADETSIIRWTLENEPQRLQDWCSINNDGTFSGVYAEQFKQAIRVEGIYKSRGKHPAGIIIAPDDLENICPLYYDESINENVAALNMKGAEFAGLVKMDLLGLLALDRLAGVNRLLRYGRI